MAIDLTQFHDSFYEESFEALGQMEQALLRLDAGDADTELINTIFRVAHSIKGGAATFGFSQISSFTHTLETVLDELRAHRLQATSTLSDLLLRSLDLLREMLHGQQAGQPCDAQRVADLQFDLELMVAQKGAGAAATVPTLYRISFRPQPQLLARGNDPLRMFGVLRELGELTVSADVSALPAWQQFDPESCYLSWTLTLRTTAARQAIMQAFDWAEGDCALEVSVLEASAHDASALEQVPAVSHAPKSGDAASIRVGIDKIDQLMNGVGELVITQSMLSQFGPLLDGIAGERLRGGLVQLERNVRALQESVMRVRMVPISFLFGRFPRMVRDLGQRLGKQVEVRMSGGETELDKTVLEKLGDPLTHLVRNCIDHGIETPQQRQASGKPACGTVHLHAWHRGSSIIVEVSDDGGGLQRERLLTKARRLGLAGAEAQLPDSALHNLIFLPGFSTQDQVNDVSGRGVGMDVVRRNVDELGGVIDVRSEAGKGVRFTITLPLTLALVEGLTVAVGDESYIVPMTAIVESLRMRTAQVNHVVGHGEVLSYQGEYLPVVRLAEVLQVRCERPRELRGGLIIIVEGDGRRVALCVDELLGQQQVVVKTLQSNYGHIDGIAGATIRGDGSVALILDVASLTRSASRSLAA
jgi:two-component system chemotaxis sensor kinase CheA